MKSRSSTSWKTSLILRQFKEQLSASVPYIRGLVVDAGCGDKPFGQFIRLHASMYIGFDLSSDGAADVVCDARYLPLADESVDTVMSFQVLDDVPEPLQLLAEMRRVLRPGGALLLSVNQNWRVHNAPHDYFRFTPYGLQYLLTKVGMNVIRISPMGGMWAYFGNRLAFWLDEALGRHLVLKPFVRCAGTAILFGKHS